MRIETAFGRHDPADVLKCSRCEGSGKCPTYHGSPTIDTCPRCAGTGADPSPSLYAYEVEFYVEVGDIVEVPASVVSPEPTEATVVRLGSTYRGEHATVIRRVQAASDR